MNVLWSSLLWTCSVKERDLLWTYLFWKGTNAIEQISNALTASSKLVWAAFANLRANKFQNKV